MTDIGPFPAVRTRELLYRWIEMEAFGSGLFRTHIGSSVSKQNSQVYQDEETMAYFTRFTQIFAHLATYRKGLMLEAESKGWPLIRSMAAHYAYDPKSWEMTSQYLFGEDFLIAPVLDATQSSSNYGSKTGKNRHDVTYSKWSVRGVKVYLPAHSTWVHLWTGQAVEGGESGRYVTVDAPFGHPPVFYKPTSVHGKQLRQFALDNHYDAVYTAEPCAHKTTPTTTSTPLHNTENQTTAPSSSSSSHHATHLPAVSITLASIGQISEYKEPTWLDWLGISEYTSSWDSNEYNPILDPYHSLYHKTSGHSIHHTVLHSTSHHEAPSTALVVCRECPTDVHDMFMTVCDDVMKTVGEMAATLVISALSSVDMCDLESTFA